MAEDDIEVERARQWFGMNLRTQREAQDMSQDDVAHNMAARGFRWHQSTVAKVERGARAVEVTEAAALAGLLQTTISEMLAEPSEMVAEMELRRAAEAAGGARQAMGTAVWRMLEAEEALKVKMDALGLEAPGDDAMKRAGSAGVTGAFLAYNEVAFTPEGVVEWARGRWQEEPGRQGRS